MAAVVRDVAARPGMPEADTLAVQYTVDVAAVASSRAFAEEQGGRCRRDLAHVSI